MSSFHTIAVPHRDILEGQLTMDVFAADLWEVYKGRGLDEYKDAGQFFKKTYETEGLKSLFTVVEKRLKGIGGDPVIQIQTPFGGGKTHALISLYHKANEWGASKVVIVGTAIGTPTTFWGMLEEQLTGKVGKFVDPVPPGRDALTQLLLEHQPVLILMDEILEYTTKAAGVKVGDTTLAAQTIAFMQELTEAAKTLEKVALVLTLPSSSIEHYDEQAERLFEQLQKVTARVERIYTPVQEQEITKIIRQRLFSHIDFTRMQDIIGEYMDYAKTESLLPAGVEPSEYKKQFESSYPFMPEVVEVLYKRWGSFPNFQRTRGIRRLLSLVIASLKADTVPYLGLADFKLGNQEIRWELLKHIGQNFDSIIAADIVGEGSGAAKVDATLGDAFRGLKLGTRTSTVIFMYSFSGGVEKGASLAEIKRSATTIGNPSSVVAEALEQLRERLFYLDQWGGKSYFTSQITPTRVLHMKMENVEKREVDQMENEVLKRTLSGKPLKTFVWPRESAEIPDYTDLKLIITKSLDDDFMRQVVEMKGGSPRVNRNTLFFLAPLASEQNTFHGAVKKLIAYRMMNDDHTLMFSNEQKKEINGGIRKCEDNFNDDLR